jgi:site-specific DNA recombinase
MDLVSQKLFPRSNPRSRVKKVRAEIDGVYRLYQDGQLDSAGFGRFFKPLEERTKQLEADLPRLQAEIDVCQVDAISAEEIVTEAQNLHRMWPKLESEEKRTIIEAITEKIVVGKDEIDILSST